MSDRLTTNVCDAAAFDAVCDSERATNLPSAAVPLSCVCLEACRAEHFLGYVARPSFWCTLSRPSLGAGAAEIDKCCKVLRTTRAYSLTPTKPLTQSSSCYHGNADHDGMKREGQRKVGNYSDRERNGIITPTADRNRGSSRVGAPLERDAVKYRPSQE